MSGKDVTGFARSEEVVAGVANKVPYNAEAEMKQRGAHYRKAALPFLPYAVVDGRLITGQNPFSAKARPKGLWLRWRLGQPRTDRRLGRCLRGIGASQEHAGRDASDIVGAGHIARLALDVGQPLQLCSRSIVRVSSDYLALSSRARLTNAFSAADEFRRPG